VLVFVLLLAIVIHAAAALKHQFIDRLPAAGRMPPFETPRHVPTVIGQAIAQGCSDASNGLSVVFEDSHCRLTVTGSLAANRPIGRSRRYSRFREGHPRFGRLGLFAPRSQP